MKRWSAFFGVLALVLLWTGEALATTTTIISTQDAYILSDEEDANHGTEPFLQLHTDGVGSARTLVFFPQAAIEGAANASDLLSATLEVFIESNENNWTGGSGFVDAHRLTEFWGETTVTWNCGVDINPGNGSPDCVNPEWDGGTYEASASDTATISNGDLGIWVSFDVTLDVFAFLADPADNKGWIIKRNNEVLPDVGSVEFTSRTGTAGQEPRLVIVAGATPTPSRTITRTRTATPISTPTPSRTGTRTPTLSSGDHINIDIGSDIGVRGGVVEIPVSLNDEDGDPPRVAGLSIDITYESSDFSLNPADCIADPSLNKITIGGGGAGSHTLSAGIIGSFGDFSVVRVSLSPVPITSTIPNGTIFSCKFGVKSDATFGNHTLINGLKTAKDEDGIFFPSSEITGVNGNIEVVEPLECGYVSLDAQKAEDIRSILITGNVGSTNEANFRLHTAFDKDGGTAGIIFSNNDLSTSAGEFFQSEAASGLPPSIGSAPSIDVFENTGDDTILPGRLVCADFSKSYIAVVKVCEPSDDEEEVVGVAVDTIITNAFGRVITGGTAWGVACEEVGSGSIVAGTLLRRSSEDDGRVEKFSSPVLGQVAGKAISPCDDNGLVTAIIGGW